MYYASIGLLSLVILCIINLEYLKPVKSRKFTVSEERYRLFLYSVAVFLVSDFLWGTLTGSKIIVLAYIGTLLFFISMVTSVLLWTRFVIAYLGRKGRFAIILTASGWLIFISEIGALLVNLLIPIVFEYTSSGEYKTGIVRFITLFAQLSLYLITSAYTMMEAYKADGNAELHHRTIGISGLVMAGFIALQAFYPNMPFYSMGCLIATCIIHTFVVQGEKYEHKKELGSAKQIAYRDPLTGVKSARAYQEAKELIDQRISSLQLKELGVIVFDLNNLKQINDNLGHEAGDKYIKDGGDLICNQFQHSPVYRIGGDEFVVLLEGEDYMQRKALLEDFDQKMEANNREGKIVISTGLDIFRPGRDINYDSIFERADQRMYERKKSLKAMNMKTTA